jgi:hypothetical protein
MSTHKECSFLVLNHLLKHYEDYVSPEDVAEIIKEKYPQERVTNTKIRHIDEQFIKLRRRLFKQQSSYMSNRGHDVLKELDEIEGVGK